MADEAVALTLESITALLDTKLQEMTNKYDKNLEKHIGKHLAPVVEDLKTQFAGGVKPKKLAKIMARMEAKKAEKDAAAKAAAQGKTPAEIEAARVAAEATAAAANRGNKNKDDRDRDMFRKKERDEFDDRIRVLEERNAAAEKRTAEAILDSALDRALTDFPWANLDSRDLARSLYRPQLKAEDDGQIMIGDRKFDEHIKAEIPTKYENLLQTKKVGGAGIQKGTGKGPTTADLVDNLGPNSTPEEKAAALKGVASIMGA
jgi:hypothetical protein